MDKTTRILIVEDDPIISTDLKRTLSKLGHEVTSVVTEGRRAIEKTAEDQPDLVLMDIKLPGSIDGIDAAAHIRANYHIPVIYLTAHSNKSLIERSKLTEPYGYLLKPFREKELQANIEMALFKHELESQLQETNRRLEHEIAERKQAEEALQKAHDELEMRVQERTVELSEANEHLKQEIIERERTARALQMSVQQYRLLIENATDGIGIIQEKKWGFVNDVLASMLGYSSAQLVGRTPAALFHKNFEEQLQKMYKRLEQDSTHSQNWQVLQCIVTENECELWVEGRYSHIDWQGKPAILVSMRDITEGKLRELTLEKEREDLQKENIQLKATIKDRYNLGAIIGESPVIQEIYELILKAAATNANVLIAGESGTGKELIAQTIHQLSERREGAFVAVNCAGFTEPLFESEFFGCGL